MLINLYCENIILKSLGEQIALNCCFEIKGTSDSRFDGAGYPVYEVLMLYACLRLAPRSNLGTGFIYPE
jgi:hypothetical protein